MLRFADLEGWPRFLVLVAQWQGHGIWRFEKELRAFAESEGWDWMPLDDKQQFHRWSLILYKAAGRLIYYSDRREQRNAARFDLWVYRCYDATCCPAEHVELDGIVLPPDHPFWRRYLPPNDWDCSCDVSGARFPGGATRIGGDPDKPLPLWWQQGKGIGKEFDDNALPSLERVLELLIDGYFD